MSDHHTVRLVNSPLLISAREAGLRVGYTVDYVSRLARQGKVIGEKRGRQWFVDVESLKLFSLHAKREQQLRQEELRQVRKAELIQLQKKMNEQVAAVRAVNLPTIAAGQAAIVMAVFAIMMTLVWGAYDAKLNLQALSIGAFDVGSTLRSIFFTETNDTAPEVNTAASGVETSGVPEGQHGLVIFDQASSTASINEHFADEVEVEFTGTSSGVIRPVFRSGTSTGYQFLMVPITDTTRRHE